MKKQELAAIGIDLFKTEKIEQNFNEIKIIQTTNTTHNSDSSGISYQLSADEFGSKVEHTESIKAIQLSSEKNIVNQLLEFKQTE